MTIYSGDELQKVSSQKTKRVGLSPVGGVQILCPHHLSLPPARRASQYWASLCVVGRG